MEKYVREINDHNTVNNLLKREFKGYNLSDDPFEKFVVYKKNKGIISYSIIYERAEINYIVVKDKRKGIGSKLLEYALADIKKHKCKIISLEVEEDNVPAINLYLKFGFKKAATRENYYKDKNGILMIKEMR